MSVEEEKELFEYGLLAVFVSIGIVFLLTGNVIRSANAGITALMLMLIAMIAIRYKTKTYLQTHKYANILVLILLGICIAVLIGIFVMPASALNLTINQSGAYTTLNIDGIPPYDIYISDGTEYRDTYSAEYKLNLEENLEHTITVKDFTNATISKTVVVPLINVPLEITIAVILCVLISLLGIRYPIFIVPAMALALLWFAFWGINPDISETQRIIHSLLAISPFLSMAFWGINK